MTSPQTELREKLAELEHQQWAHWETYRDARLSALDDLDEDNENSKETIKQLTKWKILRKTEYKDLTENEKESDRKWVDKVLAIVNDQHHFEMEQLLTRISKLKLDTPVTNKGEGWNDAILSIIEIIGEEYLAKKEDKRKVVILDNNPLSIACYMEEHPEFSFEEKEGEKMLRCCPQNNKEEQVR